MNINLDIISKIYVYIYIYGQRDLHRTARVALPGSRSGQLSGSRTARDQDSSNGGALQTWCSDLYAVIYYFIM